MRVAFIGCKEFGKRNGGRVHTSAATVAVLPEAEEVDVEIANSDIRIDAMNHLVQEVNM